MAKSTNTQNNIGGLTFVGCMMVGIGVGVLVNQAGAGTLIGLGVGFLAMALLRNKK
jgi:hypothetical protein